MPRNYVNRIFECERVTLDGVKAIDVIFRRCTLIYNGGNLHAEGCDFIDCNMIFGDEAAHDKFMRGISDGEGNYSDFDKAKEG